MAPASSLIELRHLRTFIAAADFGSFRKASAALRVRESAVSRRIRDLEDELGASLFHRHSGGVSLTLAGDRYLARARRVLDELGEGADDVAAIGTVETGRLRIGIMSSLGPGFQADLFKTFKTRQPGVEILVDDGDPRDHVAALCRGELDVALLAGIESCPGCRIELLWREQAYAALAEGHRLVAHERVDWAELGAEVFVANAEPRSLWIRELLAGRIAAAGHVPRICAHVLGRHNLMGLVAMGDGLAITGEAMRALAPPGVVFRPIVGERFDFNAVWVDDNDNPACRRLLSLARAMARRYQQPARQRTSPPPSCSSPSRTPCRSR